MPATTRPPRRPTAAARTAAGVAMALAAWLLAGGVAAAQIDTSATDVAADGTTTVVVTVASGCDGADTTGLVLSLPAGATDVTPLDADGGMTATVDGGTVTWGGGVLPSDQPGRLTLSLLLAQADGEEVALPVEQRCGDAAVAWRALATAPSRPGDLPAPVLVVPEGAGGRAAPTTPATVDEDRPAAAAVAAAPEDESALGGGAVGFMVFAGVMVALAGGATYLVIRSRKA